LDSGAARPLAGTEGASYPFWSPDSASVGFFADSKLKRIDIAGGALQVLANTGTAGTARGGAWSRDGTILFAPLTNGPLLKVPAAGGEPVAVTRLETGQGTAGHRFPQFLPDGRHFIYFVRDGRGVYGGSLDGTASMRAQTRAAVAALFFLGVLGLVVWIGSDPVMSRFETLGQEYNLGGQNRISIWRDTLGLIRHHPLLGTGLGSFSTVYPSVQTVFLTLLVEHAHCDYLEVASELGLPGAILVFGSIFWVLAQTAGQYKKTEESFDKAVSLGCIGSIAAILVHSLADFNLYIPANALVFTVILALAWSHARPEETPAESLRPCSRDIKSCWPSLKVLRVHAR